MILGILFLIIGIIIGIINKFNVPFFYIAWISIIPFFVDLILPFSDIRNYYIFRSYASYYIVLMLAYQFFQNIKTLKLFLRENGTIIICLIFILFYFIFLSISRGIGFSYLNYMSNNLSHLFLLFFILICPPSSKSTLHFIIITFLIQIIIGILQEFNFFQFSFNNTSDAVSKFLTGGMTGNNIYGNFLTVILIILFLELISVNIFNSKLQKSFIFISILAGTFLIFDTGIRMSLLSYLLAFYLIFNKYYKKLSIFLLIGFIIIFFGIETTSNVLSQYTKSNYATNLERQTAIFSLTNGWEALLSSTFGFSIFLIIYYFIDSPWFGSGLFYKNGGYAGFINSTSGNETDVTAALFLTEFGIIGTCLLFLLYKSIFNKIKEFTGNNFWKFKILMIVILIQTITDFGIFDIILMPYLYLYFNYLNIKNNLTAESIVINNNVLQSGEYSK